MGFRIWMVILLTVAIDAHEWMPGNIWGAVLQTIAMVLFVSDLPAFCESAFRRSIERQFRRDIGGKTPDELKKELAAAIEKIKKEMDKD